MDAVQHRRLQIISAHLCASNGAERQEQTQPLLAQEHTRGAHKGESASAAAAAVAAAFSESNARAAGLSEADQKILRENYIWDGKDVELRVRMREYFSANAVDFHIDHAGAHATMDGAIPWAHGRAVEVMKQRFIEPRHLRDDPSRVFSWLGSIVAPGDVATKCSIHITLYEAMVALLGTSRHDKYLDEVDSNLGFFAMSEVGHASNLKKLGTTATFDAAQGCFVLRTTDTLAQKCWIGNSFYSSKNGVVFAHLIVDGKNHGLHAFVVNIRDAEHRLREGVRTKLVGLKGGLHGLDNGRIMFDEFKVPRENLLNRYADVNAKTGKYETSIKDDQLRFAKHIGALLIARLGVGISSVAHAQLGITVATRYAFRRQQFAPDSKSKELPLMFYQSHRNTLMPLLAGTYAAGYFQNYAMARYVSATEKELKEVHLLASAIKAATSWYSLDLLQKCRELCGGQGYLARNGIVVWKATQDVWCTLDGANNLLFQQISQVLLHNYGKQYKERSIIGQLLLQLREKAAEFTRGGMLLQTGNTAEEHLRSRQFLLGALTYRTETLLHALAKKLLVESRASGDWLAFNDRAQTDALQLAQAFCDQQIAEAIDRVVAKQEKQLGADHSITVANRIMLQLYVVSKLTHGDGATFVVEHGLASASKLRALRDLEDTLCRQLAPLSLSLCDAFGMPEYIYDRTIGSKKYSLEELVNFANADPKVY